jgi:hypothetical protein
VISNILNWDKELQTFWQSKGTKDLDASMPLIWFISPVDPMWRSTVEVIEARLVEDTLIRRYEAERTHVDGIPGGEVASLRAHFGTSNTLARVGSWKSLNCCLRNSWDARIILGSTRKLGPSGQHLGNFPPACKRLALISTATYGLNDSSSGLGARIVEKSRAWSDCGVGINPASPRTNS